MFSTSPRRLSFASAATLGALWAGALWIVLSVAALPSVAAQEPADAPAGAVDARADVGGAFGTPAAPAPQAGARNRRRAMTETLWYLFFVTAGALFALVGIVWAFGWYKRTFLQDDPLQAELFDAATRAEIERHRKQVQAEQEAAKRAAETETTHADRETLPDSLPPGAAGASSPEAPRDTLSEQTAAPPDPAVQPDADAR